MATNVCKPAADLVALATENGWKVDLDETDETIDVMVSSAWKHPDTGQGWEWGCALRWFNTKRPSGRQTWSLGSLDNAGKHIVGGVARQLPDGTDFEFWLSSVRVLRDFIIDPDDFVVWFEKVAPR